MLACMIYLRKRYLVKPTEEQYNALFNKEWSDEAVPKPKRDWAFYILRIIGFIYLAYLSI